MLRNRRSQSSLCCLDLLDQETGRSQPVPFKLKRELFIHDVLDGFIDLVRVEQQRSRTQGEKLQPSRPSVRDKLKQELPAHKPAAPKKQGPER